MKKTFLYYLQSYPVSLFYLSLTLLSLVSCAGAPIQSRKVDEQTSIQNIVKNTPAPTISPSSTLQPTITPTPTEKPLRHVELPVRLQIPAIGIDASIEPVGLKPDGQMEAPIQNEWDGTGWYNLGPRPGQRGSAVIDGHLGRPDGTPAVFHSLSLLQSGDELLVLDAQGTKQRFQVTRLALYHPDSAPLQAIFGRKDNTYLNLITCAGIWSEDQQQMTERLVVYASFIEEIPG